MSTSDPVYRCQAKWDDVHCNGDGVERLIPKMNASLAGAQLKFACSRVFICDDCWPKAKPFLLQSHGHPKEAVEEAMRDAGMEVPEGGL
jgi:hypothetical protein